jgi:hypothetical protein
VHDFLTQETEEFHADQARLFTKTAFKSRSYISLKRTVIFWKEIRTEK